MAQLAAAARQSDDRMAGTQGERWTTQIRASERRLRASLIEYLDMLDGTQGEI